ncbi:MAG TPA: aminoglycoside phosphotransferase family protein [Marmoricola sp.]|nr:aminoglycoside phosphotransferase family protein [Marmoricola sp.]
MSRLEPLLEEWELTRDGPPRAGGRADIVPVRTASGRPAVLKVGDAAGSHEPLALQHWHGRGAVELLRADPRRDALLLERLHAEDVGELWDVAACEVVGALYDRLHVPAPARLRRLSEVVDGWLVRLAALPRNAPLPHRLVEQALAIGRRLKDDRATDGRLLHGALGFDHVLSADREPWLAVAPKPLSGDPHAEPAPALWSRWDELVRSGDVRGSVRRRFHTLVDVAGLDEERARDWAVLRAVVQAATELGTRERGRATTFVTVAKAVQE